MRKEIPSSRRLIRSRFSRLKWNVLFRKILCYENERSNKECQVLTPGRR